MCTDRIPCYEDDDGHRQGHSRLCSACSRRLDIRGKRKRREDELAAELETDEDTDESESEKHGRSEGATPRLNDRFSCGRSVAVVWAGS